jgi:hypothetical protein
MLMPDLCRHIFQTGFGLALAAESGRRRGGAAFKATASVKPTESIKPIETVAPENQKPQITCRRVEILPPPTQQKSKGMRV